VRREIRSRAQHAAAKSQRQLAMLQQQAADKSAAVSPSAAMIIGSSSTGPRAASADRPWGTGGQQRRIARSGFDSPRAARKLAL